MTEDNITKVPASGIYDIDVELDLVEEISKAMKLMKFKPENIEKFRKSNEAIACKQLPPVLQKSQLLYYFNSLILLSGIETPDGIRLLLTIAIRPIDWLADLTTGFLPFIKENEDQYFK